MASASRSSGSAAVGHTLGLPMGDLPQDSVSVRPGPRLESAGMLTERQDEMPSTRTRRSGAEVEQIAILCLALVCGLVGLAVHVFWFVSIVLMAVLLGLTAAAVRRRPGHGVVSEVLAEAKSRGGRNQQRWLGRRFTEGLRDPTPADPDPQAIEAVPGPTDPEPFETQTTDSRISTLASEPSSSPLPANTIHRSPTRLSATWTAVVAAAVVLIALIIFIGQNTQQSSVNFLGAHGKAPTSVVLLIAATAGTLIVIIVGIARIIQLQHVAKHADQETS